MKLLETLEAAQQQGQFTAWSLGANTWAMSCFYADELSPPLEGNCEWPGTLHPRFDLASLTKPLFANRLVRDLLASNEAMAGLPLRELMESPLTEPGHLLRNTELSLNSLLNHRAGFPQWRWFGRAIQANDPESLLTDLCRNLLASSEQNEVYSDLSYFVAARIIQELGLRQDRGWSWSSALEKINRADGTQFVHATLNGEASRKAIPSFPYTSLQLQDFPENSLTSHDFGVPHDTNANILAGLGIVSGHAGLFGSVLDVLSGSRALAAGQVKWDPTPSVGKRFSAGLDSPCDSNSLSAPREWPLSPSTRIHGHLGFTGTAFWFEILEEELKCAQAFLSNRTASRLVLGPVTVPRLLIYSDLSGFPGPVKETETRCFLTERGQIRQELSRNDAEEIIVLHSRTTTRLWNRSDLRITPNINSLRRSVAATLWHSESEKVGKPA